MTTREQLIAILDAVDAQHDFDSGDVPSSAEYADAIFAAGITERDEYHTMTELYEYRMLYNAHAAHGWLAAGIPVVKSWKHSDGEPCFGGGWFIVSAQLPTGQVTNHYKAEHWDLFNVPQVELPPAYDGHTPADAALRLRDATPTPAPAPAQVVGAEQGEAARYHALRLTLMADHMQGADYKRNLPDIIKLRNAVTFLDTLHAAGMTVPTEGVE